MRKLIFLILAGLYCTCGFGQITAFRDTVKNGYNFWLYEPKIADSLSVRPIVLFLHGNSLCGSDLNKVRQYGCIDAVEKGMVIDAFIIAPQNPGGAWNPRKVKNVLDWVQLNYRTDTARVYVVGMSLGGYGTMDFAGTYPHSVTAAVALCGGTTLKNYDALSEVPLWIIHGAADRAVSVRESQRVVDGLRSKGDTSLLRYERMDGVGHGALARVFYLPQLYEWMFAHRGADTTLLPLNVDYMITTASLKNPYRSLDKNGEKPKIVDEAKVAASSATSTRSVGGAAVHVVKSGDTLGAIAKRHRTTVAKLCAANGISAKSILRLGQKIALPSNL